MIHLNQEGTKKLAANIRESIYECLDIERRPKVKREGGKFNSKGWDFGHKYQTSQKRGDQNNQQRLGRRYNKEDRGYQGREYYHRQQQPQRFYDHDSQDLDAGHNDRWVNQNRWGSNYQNSHQQHTSYH